jgi:hypothetical protein
MLIPVPAGLGYPALGALIFGESTGLPGASDVTVALIRAH